MANEKPLGFWGLKNVKRAARSADGKLGTSVVELPKGKSLQLNASVNMQEVYAGDERILMIPSDNGYAGTYGCTGQDLDFEEEIGLLIKLDDGTYADVNLTDMERSELYFEKTVKPASGRAFVMKAWIYGVEFGKPSKNHGTNTQNVTIGEYQYPITVYGKKILKTDESPYTDEGGNEKTAWIIYSVPGDGGYSTFGNAPPPPIKNNTPAP